MSIVILGIVGIATSTLFARYIGRRRRARLTIKEQYLSASGLRWLRTHIPMVLLGATLLAASMGPAQCRLIVM